MRLINSGFCVQVHFSANFRHLHCSWSNVPRGHTRYLLTYPPGAILEMWKNSKLLCCDPMDSTSTGGRRNAAPYRKQNSKIEGE
jgi:hypothetical protein